ncbi:hypothetical protein [Algibacter lectus]|uniref:Uncharacterized protein n=2 Tax=Algibacter lectus TaxID=221126 RepID=A0A4R8M830_9FLAO|nr:hypothetical protein [Algibacter lectus]MWW26560.1 hypothetical protein [Algibacter lectus]TDY59746.1 hypothetical protein DFQ06_3780 [Algibacter lectus]SFD58682.1 hypothetical protein SAMN04489722_112135 [Algibacter lectus]
MENGYVIIGIIALLFVSMYGYSYWSVFKEKARQKEEGLMQKKAQEKRRQDRVEKQEALLERVRVFNERKEEKRAETRMLRKVKKEQKVS